MMKRIFFFVPALILVSLPSFSQVIKGTVTDKNTKEPVISAAIFFSGTSVGALSDEKGNFHLDISKYPKMPLTVSAIGYYSLTLNEYDKDKPLSIMLTPKTFELGEVVVKERSRWLQRSENLTIFRNEFLGTTANSMNCSILNEQDIRFKTSANGDTIKAFSVNPIQIHNKALGYSITYFLDKFVYCKGSQTFMFEGKILFREDTIPSETQRGYIDRKRKAAYLGSRMHFLRSLWIDNLNGAGFSVRNSSSESINYKRIVIDNGNNRKFLHYPGNFGIGYFNKQSTSFVIFHKDRVFFDATGYYEADGISWEGEMSRQRIADMLPYDYYPKDNR